MDQNQDFSALRNLLALKRLEIPMDTETNRFLIGTARIGGGFEGGKSARSYGRTIARLVWSIF